MARKKKNADLSMFAQALNDITGGAPDQMESVTVIDDEYNFPDKDDDIDPNEDNNEPDPVKEPEEDKKDPHEDNSPIPEDVLNNINNEPSQEPPVEEPEDEEGSSEEVDPQEAAGVGAFFDAFAEALNWDVSDDDKPQSIDDLIDYISDVVEQNSRPEYADQRIEQLDNYVRNGGRFEDFYSSAQRTLEYSNLDMEDESNQRTVVRDYMKLQGYDDEAINRKIERYEDADMLEEEAADAVVYLKRVQEQQLAQIQQAQEQARREQEQQAMEFMTSLNNSISTLDNVRGISVPKEDRKALLDYITKTDSDGLTQYQKDFNKNMVNNLIESAYFTMKGDALLGSATRNGQTSAANKLRTMLKHQTRNHSSYNVENEKPAQLWEVASKFL